MAKSHRSSSLVSSLLVCSIFLIASTLAAGQAGTLDPSFGRGGIVTTDFGDRINGNVAMATAVTIQPDGKILVCGGIPSTTGFPIAAVARYNTDGSLDTTFGTSGIVTTQNLTVPSAITLQTDGKIVVAGPSEGLVIDVARYLPNGTLDSTFGTNGIFTTGLNFRGSAPASQVIVQPDGKILVADGFLLRLLADGEIDSSFGTTGAATVVGNSATALALLPNGKIVASSVNGLISRYTSSGILDISFGVNGQLSSPGPANALVLLSTGAFLVDGSLTSSLSGPTTGFAVFRYLGAGVTDATFATHGGVVTPVPTFSSVTASALGLQSSGDIVILGSASTLANPVFALARYTPSGQLDSTFGTNGTVTTTFGTTTLSAPGIAIQSNGDIVAVAGFTTTVPHGEFETGFKLARYLGQ
jgi:uncharacterized delta-60 repeat protein